MLGELEGATLDLKGIGLLNWVVKRWIQGEVEQRVTNALLIRGKEVFSNEFSQISLIDEMYTSFKIL